MNNGASGIRVGVPVCPQLGDGIANSGGLQLGTVNCASRIVANMRLFRFCSEKYSSEFTQACMQIVGGPNLQMLASERGNVGGEWWVLGTILNGGKLQKAKYWAGPYKHLVQQGLLLCCSSVEFLAGPTMFVGGYW